MRFPPFSDLRSRDGTLLRGPRVVNGYVESVNKQMYVQKRPALALVDATLTGVGGGLWTDPKGTLGTVGVNGTGTAATLFKFSASALGWSFVPTVEPIVVLVGLSGGTNIVLVRSGTSVGSKSSASSLIPAPVGYTQRSSGSFVHNLITDAFLTGFSAVSPPTMGAAFSGVAWISFSEAVGLPSLAYSSDLGATWEENSILGTSRSVSNLTQGQAPDLDGTARAISTAHGFSNGDLVYVSGATPTAYNGFKTVGTVLANEFTYTVPVGTASPATGTITVQRVFTSVLGLVAFASELWAYGGGIAVHNSSPLTWAGWTPEALSGAPASLLFCGFGVSPSHVFIMGGHESGVPVSKVYSSSNGKDFSLVTSSPGWSARTFPQIMYASGVLYVIGGVGTDGNDIADVWASTDEGATWTNVSPAEFSTGPIPGLALARLASCVSDGKLVFLYVSLNDALEIFSNLYERTGAGSMAQVAIGTVSNPNGVLASFAGT